MRVAQKFAGYSLAEADNLRKACGKKIRELIAAGAREVRRRAASAPATAPSSARSCSTSSSRSPTTPSTRATPTATGCVAYQTAYLKAHYPVEYLACLLTSVKGNLDKAAVYLAECRAMGIEVLVPDVNLSVSDFVALEPDDGAAGRRAAAGLPGRHPVRAVRRAQRRRGARRADRRRARGERARSPTSTTSATGSTSACSTSGPSSR